MKKINNKIIKNIIHIANGTAISSGLSLINTALLISAIGMKNNGAIFLAQSYADFFNALFNFQSYDAIIKFMPEHMGKNDEKCKDYIKLAIVLDIITAITAMLASVLFLDKIAIYLSFDKDVVLYAKILIITIIFTVNGAFTGILRVYGKFNYIAISKSSGSIITFICYIIGYINNFSIIYYVLSILLSKIVIFLIDFILTYKTLKEHQMNKINLKRINLDIEFIKFTIGTNLRSTLDLPITHMVPVIINKYLGLEEITVYKVLEKIGNIVSMAINIISQVISPEISKKIAEKDILGVQKISRLFMKIVVFVGIIILIMMGITYKLWIGLFINNYERYMACVYLYIIYVIYTSAFACQDPIFIYAGFIRYNLYILIIVNLCYVILLILMTKSMGLKGVIISRLIQASCIFLMKGIILNKYIKDSKSLNKIA